MKPLLKPLLLVPILLAPAFLTPNHATAYAVIGGPDSARKIEKSHTMESRLEYRFFQNANRKNYYTLALEHTMTEPAVIRILGENGTQLYRAEVYSASLVRHIDLRKAEPGRYLLQISLGSQVREEQIVID